MAGTRLALVLGNSKYQSVPQLDNPANDAGDLAVALRRLGFDVIEQRDASRDAMAKAVHDFSERLPGAELALFFYAGHGLQMNGENYLVPVDAKIQNAADVRFNTINLTDIQQEMDSGGRTNIIILDACRDNPFADKLAQSGRSLGGRGLVRVEAASQGSLIVYSTQPNNIALDGAGRNSPFTAALLRHVGTPGLEIRQMLSRVRGDVLASTDKKQTPWDSSSLVGDVYLAGAAAPPSSTKPLPSDAGTIEPTTRSSTAGGAAAVAEAPPRSTTPPPPEPVSECDAIAAIRPFNASTAAVHATTEPDWARGVTACEAEVRAHPGDMRLVFQLGRAQDNMKDYLPAVRNYRTAADAGLADAIHNLGTMYYFGHGVMQSYPTAFDLFSKAAAVGSPRSLSALAAMYSNGQGVAKDDARGLAFAEKAAQAGNPLGLAIMADHYFNGAGVPRDYSMAGQYYQQAADLGDGRSMKFLANMYESGYLGPPNPAKANELRLRAQTVAPGSPDPMPPHLPMFKPVSATPTQTSSPAPRRPNSSSSYNPAWQAAPGDTSCCPNNMLVCPLGRHFCPR